MKIRALWMLAAAVSGALVGSAAHAEPQPQPPTGVRPAPPTGVDPRPSHDGHDAHNNGHDGHNNGHDGHNNGHEERDQHQQAGAHQETEAQLRDRLQKMQEADRSHRRDARKDAAAWQASREQRAAQGRKDVAATWGNLAERADAKAELATHADRMAQLNRIMDVAEDKGDSALIAHTKNVIAREVARDARVLQAIRTNAGGQ